MGSPAPIAAASGSSIRCTERAPAATHASVSARRSTPVIPDGAHIITRGRARRPLWARAMKWRSIFSVTSKSAITPWRNGRTAEIRAGVRPIIRWASSPTACTAPLSVSIATTEGSDDTIPSPRTNTSVLAVPRSIAMSCARMRGSSRRLSGERADPRLAPPPAEMVPAGPGPRREPPPPLPGGDRTLGRGNQKVAGHVAHASQARHGQREIGVGQQALEHLLHAVLTLEREPPHPRPSHQHGLRAQRHRLQHVRARCARRCPPARAPRCPPRRAPTEADRRA